MAWTIPPADGRHYSGICHLDVVPVDDVLAVPEEVLGTIAAPVVLRTGASWGRVQFLDDNGHFREHWRLRDGAQYVEATISGAIARDSVELLQRLWAAKGRRFLVRFSTRLGHTLLMGGMATPAMLLVGGRDAGKEPGSDRYAYDGIFTLATRWPVPYYLPAVGPPGPPPGCPTLAQLVPQATIPELLAALTPEQLAALTALANCPTLAQLVAAATGPALYAVLTPEQAIYIANQVIEVVDGGNAGTPDADVVDGGGGAPLVPGPHYHPLHYSPTGYKTA